MPPLFELQWGFESGAKIAEIRLILSNITFKNCNRAINLTIVSTCNYTKPFSIITKVRMHGY